MRKRILAFVLAAAMLLPAAVLAAAQPALPPLPDNYAVLDNAGVLSTETIRHLVNGNEQLFNTTGGEVMFLMENFTPAGTTIEDYARSVFNHWEVGSVQNNNGILVVVDVLDGYYWTVVGDGLAHHMPASVINQFMRDYFSEYFAEGNYNAAVVTLFNAFADRIYQLFPPQIHGVQPIIAPYQPAPAQGAGNWGTTFIVFIVILLLFAVIIISSGRRGRVMGPGPMGVPMMPRRRRWGWGSFMGGYMMGRSSANRQNRNPGGMGGFGGPPMGGGFTRGGSSSFGGGGASRGGRTGGGFTRGGSTRGGGGGRRR